MTGDQDTLLIDQYRVGEPELQDRRSQLLDLLFGMGPGIARIRFEIADRSINDL
jgi:hypothetical protein